MSKSKQRRKPIKLDVDDFLSVIQLGLTQKEGAQYLDICLSSFKRQFSKTQLKWPPLNELRFHKHHRSMRTRLNRMIDFLEVELLHKEESILKDYVKEADVKSTLIQLSSEVNDSIRSNGVKMMCSPFFGDITMINGPWMLDLEKSNRVGVVVLDPYLNVIACNKLYHEITGFSPEDCAPSFSHVDNVMLQIFPPQFYIGIYQRMLGGVDYLCLQNTWRTKNGGRVYVKLTFRRFRPAPNLPFLGYFELEPASGKAPAFSMREIAVAKNFSEDLIEDHILSFSLLHSNL